MKTTRNEDNPSSQTIDSSRRRLLGAAGGGALFAALGGLATSTSAVASSSASPIRWGIVGTGGIANSMAPRIQQANQAELAAVSSRRMETANEFADQHGIDARFDSWNEMISSDVIDAVYIATPTSVREEIAVAAAQAGKHVLGEKPFANLPSLKRITAACRENGVGFMDGTHFVHHPRTLTIKADMAELTGRSLSVASAFQFGLTDTSNIRLRPNLEPYGAIGDTGWYNMRAAVEYLPDDVELVSCESFLRRHPETGAANSGSGVLRFSDGSSSTWNCGFESGGAVMDLRITGPDGVIKIDDFLSQRREDNAGVFELLRGWGNKETVEVPSEKTGSTLMFERFAAMTRDPQLFEASVRASERTQAWLDAAWESALENEEA